MKLRNSEREVDVTPSGTLRKICSRLEAITVGLNAVNAQIDERINELTREEHRA